MSRFRSLVILVVAALALVVARQLLERGGQHEQGCGGVRAVHERVAFVEEVDDVPSARVLAETGRAVRQAAATAPSAVALDLERIADAYDALARLHAGFDPDDVTTYEVIEQAAAEIEAQEAIVEQARPAVAAWLDDRCE